MTKKIVIERNELLLPRLKEEGLDLDQRLMRCLEMVASYSLDDNHIVQGLIELNTSIVGRFDLKLPDRKSENINWFPYYGAPRTSVWEARPESSNRELWSEAANLSLARGSSIIGTRDYLRAISNHLEMGRTEQGYILSSIDLLTWALKGSRYTVSDIINHLTQLESGDEDIQYVLTYEPAENKLLFRAVSFLKDVTQESDGGSLKSQRALLTHYRDAFGIVFQHEIDELEDLLNSSKSKELDFQKFFEAHPNFFGFWDYKEIHPQIYLQRKDKGPLVPDFILTDPELQQAMIVDLKQASFKVIRNQKNRERFSSAVYEARSQLLTYRDFFRSEEDRKKYEDILKMRIYEPRLAMIIGRRSDFNNLDRQVLDSHTPDIEVLTYDDILTHARRRRALIAPSLR